MLNVKPITSSYAVARRPATAEDYLAVAEAGFRTILDFLPDGETSALPAAQEARRLSESAGLTFIHIPAAKFDLFSDEVVSRAAAVLASAEGPVLAVCASGQRAAIIWAAATARSEGAAPVLKALARAGFDFAFLRDDLEAQAARSTWAANTESLVAA